MVMKYLKSLHQHLARQLQAILLKCSNTERLPYRKGIMQSSRRTQQCQATQPDCANTILPTVTENLYQDTKL